MGLTQEIKKPEPVNEEPLDLNVGALDFGLLQQSVPSAPAPEASDFNLDVDFPSANEPMNGSAHSNESAALDLDLSGISLDLNPPKAEPSSDINLDLNVAESDLNGDYHPDSEMATKLDLAIAYQEIGDKDGARELLDEVIKGGTSEQSERAKTMLVRLA
jgi:pilus assembly protein FimV